MSLGLTALSASPFVANLGPGERRLWRFFVALTLGIVVFVIVSVVAVLLSFAVFVLAFGWPAPVSLAGVQAFARRFTELAGSDGRSFTDAAEIIIVALPSNVLPMFSFIAIAALVHRRRIRDLATAAPRFRWRMMLAGLVISTLIIGPFLAVGQMMDPKAGPPPVVSVSQDGLQRTLYVILCLAAFIPAAMGEEILFRGWLLRQTAAVLRQPLVLMAINGVVFAAAHLEFAPDAFLERALMGAGFAYMTMRLGGVEMSCGVHAANNLMIVLFLEPLTLKQPPSTPVDAASLISYFALFAAYVGMAELTARWAPLRQWTHAEPPPPASAEAEHFS